jgi:hypothetical protein
LHTYFASSKADNESLHVYFEAKKAVNFVLPGISTLKKRALPATDAVAPKL